MVLTLIGLDRAGPALHIRGMNRVLPVLMRLAAMLLLAAGVFAAPAWPNPRAGEIEALATPPDGAACAYQRLSSEDRELALLMFAREMRANQRVVYTTPTMKVVVRLVEGALGSCRAAYGWTRAQRAAAFSFAMEGLLRDAFGQIIDAQTQGRSRLVEGYFSAHRAELAGIDNLAGKNAERFAAFLEANGWPGSDETARAGAVSYLELLIGIDAHERAFRAARAVRTGPQRPASRGRS